MGSKKALDADIYVKLVHYIDIQKEAIRLLDEKLQDHAEYCEECSHFYPDMSYPETAGDSCAKLEYCDFGWDTHFMCEAEKEVKYNRAVQDVLREYGQIVRRRPCRNPFLRNMRSKGVSTKFGEYQVTFE